MYVGVCKIEFDTDTSLGNEQKELGALGEKIRQRFKICVLTESTGEGSFIALSALGHNEAKVAQRLSDVLEFCESSGFGRIIGEKTIIEHVDALCEED